LPTVWGFWGFTWPMTLSTCLRGPKTHRFCVLGPFSWALAHCFGFPRWFTRPMTVTKFSWAIAHYFGFPRWFTRPMTLSTYLICMTKNSLFLRLWPFLW
jgi:hypothetical protein